MTLMLSDDQLNALNAQIHALKAENERLTRALHKVSESPCGDKYCAAAEIANNALATKP